MVYAFFKMNDFPACNIELVDDNLKKFGPSWEETLMALEKEQEADLLPSTNGEVDSDAKCLGALSFRSSSPQRAAELLEVEGSGLRRLRKPATEFS